MAPKPEWDAPGILAAVKRKGKTLTALAEEAGLNGSACRTSLTRPFPAADKVISEFLGKPLNELWPDRYDEHGHRFDRRTIRFRAHRRAKSEQKQRQFAEAR